MNKHTNKILLSAKDVHKTYELGHVDVPVLKGASINIQEGEWVAILGASGSGKSTLLHLLGDLDHPDKDQGTIIFEGKTLSALSHRERNEFRNRDIGFVFQFYHLLPELNVLENTLLPSYVRASRSRNVFIIVLIIAAALCLIAAPFIIIRLGFELRPYAQSDISDGVYWGTFGVLAWISAELFALSITGTIASFWTELRSLFGRLSPEHRDQRVEAAQVLSSFGLGHRLKHRPSELSGGERQRVAIARALMNNPKVLLADEPTGNLDEKTGGEILDLIAKQHRDGLTIVMVTHDPAIAKLADRVVHLHDGRIVEK